jgi:hypothetical protein
MNSKGRVLLIGGVLLIIFLLLLISCERCNGSLLAGDSDQYESLHQESERLLGDETMEVSQKLAKMDSLIKAIEEFVKDKNNNDDEKSDLEQKKDELLSKKPDILYEKILKRHPELDRPSNSDPFEQIKQLEEHREDCLTYQYSNPDSKNIPMIKLFISQTENRKRSLLEDLKIRLRGMIESACQTKYFPERIFQGLGNIVGDIIILDDGCDVIVECDDRSGRSEAGPGEEALKKIIDITGKFLTGNPHKNLQAKFYHQSGQLVLNSMSMDVNGTNHTLAFP